MSNNSDDENFEENSNPDNVNSEPNNSDDENFEENSNPDNVSSKPNNSADESNQNTDKKQGKFRDKVVKSFRNTGFFLKHAGFYVKSFKKPVGSRIKKKFFNQDTEFNLINPLLFFALLIHGFDAYFGFVRDPQSSYLLFGFYAFLTLFAVFFVFKSGMTSETITIVGISLAAYILPWVVTSGFGFFNISVPPWVIFIMIFFPIWPIYIYFKSPSLFLEKVGHFYRLVIVILILFLIITNVPPQVRVKSSAIDTSSGITIVKHFLFDNTVGFVSSIGTFSQRFINKFDSITAPYHSGKVEQETKGILIEELNSRQKILVEGRPVFLDAKISGLNFKGAVEVSSSCLAVKGSETYIGNVSPKVTDVLMSVPVTVYCEFGSLPKGSYTITFSASFPFKTTAEMRYYFVDYNILRYNPSLIDKHNIPSAITSISDNGPAKIGLMSDSSPILLRDGPSVVKFGLTLENNWVSSGDIRRINELKVTLPSGLSLDNCIPPSRTEDSIRNLLSDENIYVFQPDYTFLYTTIDNCNLRLPSASSFIQGQDYITRTIFVEAEYDYVLSKNKVITVT